MSLFKLVHLISHGVLPVATLINTGALARVAQLAQGGNLEVSLRAAKVLLVSLSAAEDAADLKPLVGALRAALIALGAAGVHESAAAATLTSSFFDILGPWVGTPPDPTSSLLPESCRLLSELLVADAHVVPHLCHVIRTHPDLACGSFPANDVKGEPFCAGVILHYLDCHAGPAVAVRLAALAPDSVLRSVRAAAARGWR